MSSKVDDICTYRREITWLPTASAAAAAIGGAQAAAQDGQPREAGREHGPQVGLYFRIRWDSAQELS